MTGTLPAPADAPEPKGEPCPDCGQVHPDLSALEGMTAQQLHDVATAGLARAAEAVIQAGEPGQFPDLETALKAINYTAREVLRERLLETILGKGRDIVTRQAQAPRWSAASAVPEGQQAIQFEETSKVGPYL